MRMSVAIIVIIFSAVVLTNSVSLSFAADTNLTRGAAEISFDSYRSHDRTFSSNWNMTARQSISSSVNAMVQTTDTRLGDDNSEQYADVKQYATGFRYSGPKADASLWLDQYRSVRYFSGYRFDGRYSVSDQTTLAFAVKKSPVMDLDTLGAQGRPLLMTNNYTIKAEHTIGTAKEVQVSLARGLYSDDNKNTTYSLRFGQTLYDRGRNRLQVGAYGYRANWDNISKWYGNPLSSKSYGVTTAYRVRAGKGYWTTTFTGAWGADDNKPIEFWPSLQLQYRYQSSIYSTLVVGIAGGLRTDKASELEGLRHNYRQLSAAYQANW